MLALVCVQASSLASNWQSYYAQQVSQVSVLVLPRMPHVLCLTAVTFTGQCWYDNARLTFICGDYKVDSPPTPSCSPVPAMGLSS
jgi:hypothetical protein